MFSVNRAFSILFNCLIKLLQLLFVPHYFKFLDYEYRTSEPNVLNHGSGFLKHGFLEP